MLAANMPLLVLFCALGVYEWWMLVPSLIAIPIYFVLMKMHYIEGADFMFILWILLFFVYNPVSGHWLMALPFSIFFAACTGIAGIWIGIWNIVRGKGCVFDFEGYVPMMFPISAALVLTVMLA